ncbi:MAG: protein translocase subunit SecF, partial [Chloroflexi bacterium]|nr:protein translocase subunit SecF [Chloroflexota bacterium]
MFDFVGKKRWFMLASAVLILAGIISLAVPGGLKTGIEFKSGTSITLSTSLTLDELRDKLAEMGHGEAVIQSFGDGEYFIRTREVDPVEQDDLKFKLSEIGTIEGFDAVSPMIASETVHNAAIAVAVAAVAILLYITWAFRRMPSPLRYGTCAIVALIHDVLIVLAVFSFLGRAYDWEINPMFITALLAVIGYSVNDTIVVFDRIRETLPKGAASDFATVVNTSLTRTLGRSLNTSITTLLAVLAIYLFVGGTIKTFVMALFVGIIAGTYSSIFIAALLLVIWERGDWSGTLAKVP